MQSACAMLYFHPWLPRLYSIFPHYLINAKFSSQSREKRLLAASRPSVCSHEIIHLPLDEFLSNFMFQCITKTYGENSSLIKIGQK